MKNKKIFLKICSVVVICSILFALFAFTSFADGGQIGNSSSDVGSFTIFTKPSADHGIPFEVIHYGLANSNTSSSVEATLANNYTLSNFGITYAPGASGVSGYISDQYPRVENIPTPNVYNPLPRNTRGFIYSYYDRLGVTSPTVWRNSVISYSYYSMLCGSPVAYGLTSYPSNFPSALEMAVEETTRDSLLLDNSYACSNIEYLFNGTLLIDLITTQDNDDNYSYFTDSLVNFLITPVDLNSFNPYFYFYIEGYNIRNGELNDIDVEYVYNSPDLTFDPIDYFTLISASSLDSSDFDLNYMAEYYDSAYGLEIRPLIFNIGHFFREVVSLEGMDVVTHMSLYFGANYITNNSKILEFRNTFNSFPMLGAKVVYNNIQPFTMQRHEGAVTDYNMIGYGDIPIANDFSLTWLGDTLAGVFDVDIFGSFGLGDILFVVIGVGIFIAFLKIFAGG